MSTTVLLRADAGRDIGSGHVMRCVALAEALRDMGAACHLATADIPPALEARAGLEATVHRIDASPGSRTDLDRTLDLAAAVGADIMAVDGYAFGESWRAGLRAAGRPVLTFDDGMVSGPLHADLVVNAAPLAATLPYRSTAPGAVLLLGPRYAPLRREFRSALATPRSRLEERRNLLVSFGGADPLGLTLPCTTALVERLPTDARLDVVIGGAFADGDRVARTLGLLSDRVTVHRSVGAMAPLMADAGLALAGAGTTTGELAALAIPAVLVLVADNQEAAARQSADLGWCVVLDGRQPGVAADIADRTAALWTSPAERRAMAERVRGLVDAEGAVRIARALLDRVGG